MQGSEVEQLMGTILLGDVDNSQPKVAVLGGTWVQSGGS